MSKAKNATPAQRTYIIDYMSTHSEFAAGRFCGIQGKQTAERIWQNLTNDLNGMGPERTVKQWKKAWVDMKSRARAKTSRVARESSKTGNFGTSSSLSDDEKKIMAILGPEAALGTTGLIESIRNEGPEVVLDEETMDFAFVVEPPECSLDESSQSLHSVSASQGGSDESLHDESTVGSSSAIQQTTMDLAIIAPPECFADVLEGESSQSLHSVFPEFSSAQGVSDESLQENFLPGVSQDCFPDESSGVSRSTSSASSCSSAPKQVFKIRSGKKRSLLKKPTEKPDAHKHFGRIREAREKREKMLQDTAEKFLEAQKRNSDIQEMMAQSFKTLAETERGRLEVERARIQESAAMTASVNFMTAAVSQFTRMFAQGRQ